MSDTLRIAFLAMMVGGAAFLMLRYGRLPGNSPTPVYALWLNSRIASSRRKCLCNRLQCSTHGSNLRGDLSVSCRLVLGERARPVGLTLAPTSERPPYGSGYKKVHC